MYTWRSCNNWALNAVYFSWQCTYLLSFQLLFNFCTWKLCNTFNCPPVVLWKSFNDTASIYFSRFKRGLSATFSTSCFSLSFQQCSQYLFFNTCTYTRVHMYVYMYILTWNPCNTFNCQLLLLLLLLLLEAAAAPRIFFWVTNLPTTYPGVLPCAHLYLYV